ncbi:MAG: hypothetical protein DMD39_10465 [Gemmatimonadetes bacterium]|nr:MAG: hypothetical protein DMD39_10465 [Gemmatimonadota bacterium]
MNTGDLGSTLPTLFAELVDGAPQSEAYLLNRGDTGLLRSLDKLSAIAASALTATGSSIAAHVDHLRYGLSLMNRWAAGENPFDDADWTTSWRKTRVSAVQWKQLRDELANEAHRWLDYLKKQREIGQTDLNGVVASVAHLAYHVGAIRQIDLSARGPSVHE